MRAGHTLVQAAAARAWTGPPPRVIGLVLPLLAACSPAPTSWDGLITAKIADQYPGYRVVAGPAGLTVERPGAAPVAVDVAAIAAFCRRGPRDCDYAIDQMLVGMRSPGP